MSPRGGRTQPCDRAHARNRLDHAEKSLEVAELVAGEREIPITQRELTVALRRAKRLLEFAGDVLRR